MLQKNILIYQGTIHYSVTYGCIMVAMTARVQRAKIALRYRTYTYQMHIEYISLGECQNKGVGVGGFKPPILPKK